MMPIPSPSTHRHSVEWTVTSMTTMLSSGISFHLPLDLLLSLPCWFITWSLAVGFLLWGWPTFLVSNQSPISGSLAILLRFPNLTFSFPYSNCSKQNSNLPSPSSLAVVNYSFKVQGQVRPLVRTSTLKEDRLAVSFLSCTNLCFNIYSVPSKVFKLPLYQLFLSSPAQPPSSQPVRMITCLFSLEYLPYLSLPFTTFTSQKRSKETSHIFKQ